MSIDAFLKLLDYENFDYLYHETSLNSALNIMDKGLLIDGNNILQVDNILFTTTFFLSEDLTYDENEFIDFLESEKGIDNLREVSAMVILVSPKNLKQKIVKPYDTFYQGNYFEGLVESNYILGYIDLENMCFMPNVYCDFLEQMLENRQR